MKIVGKTDQGYLCQITETEIGIITGFGLYPTYGESKEAFYLATGQKKNGYGSPNGIPTDTEINVVGMHSYIQQLKDKQKTAKKLAKELIEIAEMITTGLPEVAIAPVKPEEMEIK